ncbi:MAG: putative aminopeptidase protein [Marinobacter sp. T13-3]|nr:MAG: putative aminopeptidase protein [Marinobacter sp. T13-3]
MEEKTIVPDNYPELRLVCWHRDPKKPITEEQAFGIYERNWRYIDTEKLSGSEKALINRLTKQYGSGVING